MTATATGDLDSALNGVSNWRIAQIRRTIVYIEQSIEAALQPFVFESNTPATWSAAVKAVSGFLDGVWAQGGLVGDSAAQSHNVQCGPSSTMTAQQVAGGLMIVQVAVQIVHPAEFVTLTFEQQTQVAG